jgi:transcriptional regulator with XRE-family HTH domain
VWVAGFCGLRPSVAGMEMRFSSAAYRELGRLLRQVRKESGLSSERLARKMGWPLTTISRMENGGRTSSTTDVIQFAVMCGLTAPELKPLVEFTRVAERKQGYYLSDELIGGSLQSLIFHESSADLCVIHQPQVIPGLLQLPDYARALIIALDCNYTEDQVAGSVRTRMDRQRILSLPDPARFTFYLHETALRLRVGTDKIMHEQLLHLVLTAGLDNVTIRIVPHAAGERSAFGGAFRFMEAVRHGPMVYLDHLRVGGLILDEPNHVNSYREVLSMLADVALDEGQSREFMATLADGYDRGSHQRVADLLAQEQLQRRSGNGLRGGGVVDPTPIYE